MRGAYKIVDNILSNFPNGSVNNIIDIGLALGMQIPWTREIAAKYEMDLYSLDINLRKFFERSLYKYLPPKGCGWESYKKTSDRFDYGYDPIIDDGSPFRVPIAFNDLVLINSSPPVYDYGDSRSFPFIMTKGLSNHYLVHSHSTKFLEWFPNDIDVMLVDGDHGYITVWNDLDIFYKKNGKVAFFDDIDTLFARTEVSMDDYIHNPDVEVESQGFSWKVKGPGGTYYSEIIEGADGMEDEIGIGNFEESIGNSSKKGVLTAVEDFILKHPEYKLKIFDTGAGGKSSMTGDYKKCGVLIKDIYLSE